MTPLTAQLPCRRDLPRHFALLGLFLTALAVHACGVEVAVPPRSLASPAGVAAARSCIATLDGETVYVAPARCEEGGDVAEGRFTTIGLVANRERESLMVADLDENVPTLVDIDPGEPNVTGIPICEGPSQVVSTPDGLFAVVLCDVAQGLSVVSVPARREVLRLQRGAIETDVDMAPDEPMIALPRPDLSQVRVDRLTFDCDGYDDRIPADCLPEVTITEVATLDTPGQPNHVHLASGGRLLVSYRDRSYLSVFVLEPTDDVTCLEIGQIPPCEVQRMGLTYECSNGLDDDGDGLVDHHDPQCYGPYGAESPEGLRGFASACTDGFDNDGDGLVDHEDIGCSSELDQNEGGGVLPTVCADGEDNDSDGLSDSDDPDCLIADWYHEASPACADGEDNDEDGDTDWPDDADCPAAGWDDESRPPACADGEDNDEDGDIDYPDDEDCSAPMMDTEEAAAACNNGFDDDGDGFVDRADPGCDDPTDDSEGSSAPVCADTVDNDGDGLADSDDPDCYGSSGRSESTFLPDGYGPVALDEGERFALVVDSANHQVLVIDFEMGLLLDVGQFDPIHTGLGIPLNRVAIKGPLGYPREFERSDDGTTRTGLDEIVAILPSSDGLGTVVSLQTTYYVETGDDRTEGIDYPLRPRDGDSSEARAGDLDCEIPEAYQESIRAARGTTESVRIHCEDPEVPQLETFDDDQVVELVSREQFTLEEGELVVETVPDDWRIRDDNWTLRYEGLIPGSDRSDGLIDDSIEGLLVSAGVNFCNLGVRAGDHVIIAEATPSLDAEADECEPFLDEVVLEYEIDFVRADALYLKAIDEEGAIGVLPSRTCFSEGFEYEIRTSSEWIATGESSGLFHSASSLSEQCVERTQDERWRGRLVEGELYENPFFSLRIVPGTVRTERDTAISFSVENHFATTALSIGPTPVDAQLARTNSGPRILVSDGGLNTLYLFDADSLLAITTLY